jgi:hypothetical protein
MRSQPPPGKRKLAPGVKSYPSNVMLSDRHRQIVLDHCRARGVTSFSAMLARMIDGFDQANPLHIDR